MGCDLGGFRPRGGCVQEGLCPDTDTIILEINDLDKFVNITSSFNTQS